MKKIRVYVDGFEGYEKRSIERARKLDAGEPIEAERCFTFELRQYENFHIVLWIFKDMCWAVGWHVLGMMMILPTLIVAADIARRNRADQSELSHNLAVCCWIAANATWMTGEFFFNDTWRPYAVVFFVLGAAALAWHYLPKLLIVRAR